MTDEPENLPEKKPSIADLFQINTSPAGQRNSLVCYDSKNLENISEIQGKDLAYARDNIVNLIEVGQEALSNLSSLAVQSQQPRSYEVLANMLKTMIDANHQLIDIHEKNRHLESEKKTDQPKSVTNQNLFVGSSEELQKIVEKMKKT
jgi:hypothetical protein